MRNILSFPARSALIAALAVAAFTAPAPVLRADDADEIRQLRQQVQELAQKLEALENKEAERDRQAAAAASAPGSAPATAANAPASAANVASAPAGASSATSAAATAAASATPLTPGSAAWESSAFPRITIDDTGFTFASPDGGTYIRLHGLVQADSRWYFDDHGVPNNDGFLLRRARLIFEGAFDKIYSFLLVPEFGGGGSGTSNAPVIYDANLGIAINPALQFRFGKFKSPIGLEMLQNDAVLLFAERSLATNLVPFRDVGVLAGGAVANRTVNYTTGVLNGAADAVYANNVDLDNNKDFVGRVFFTPFVNDKDSPLQNLGFGIAGSRGMENRSAGLTGGYKTDGQQTFFSYRSTVLSDGPAWRVSPQANYYIGPFSAQSEYTVSAVNVVSGTTQAELRNQAWQGAVGYVLTGEKASYNGITPRTIFNPSAGTWGAFEIAARVAELKVDSDAFPIFADPAASASQATAVSFGLNWYMNKAIRATVDVEKTHFDHGPGYKTPSNVTIGADEEALVTRFQVGF